MRYHQRRCETYPVLEDDFSPDSAAIRDLARIRPHIVHGGWKATLPTGLMLPAKGP